MGRNEAIESGHTRSTHPLSTSEDTLTQPSCSTIQDLSPMAMTGSPNMLMSVCFNKPFVSANFSINLLSCFCNVTLWRLNRFVAGLFFTKSINAYVSCSQHLSWHVCAA